jgi:NADPH-dependent 2,4-dienoyl-CoA reductase/sulfur reductase-like enzyme
VERHEAIVAGAGGAGLAAAAVLRKRGFETVLLERADAVGARWRSRYDGLRLNTMRLLSTLPGYRVPRRFGRYPRREDFVAYLEAYTAHHSLEPRFQTELKRIDSAGEDGDWRLETSRGPLLARYVVVATGYDAIPKLPDWAGPDDFAGELIHSSEYRSAEPYRDKDVLLVGAGNTGIDIAGFLIDAGARVSLSMRTPPNVYPRDWLGFPLQLSALPGEHLPSRLGDAFGFAMQRMIFGDLSEYGMPKPSEGYLTKFRTRLVGPAVDDGFIAALKERRTRIVAPVERLEGAEAVLTDGERIKPDAVICATGYSRGLEPVVGHLGVLRPDGLPKNYDAAPEHPAAPRLYFTGFYGAPAGQIRLFPIHARRIGRAAARDRANPH